MSTPQPEQVRIDLRLVPAALGAWTAVLAGLWIGWQAALVVAVTGALTAAVGAAAGVATRSTGLSGTAGRTVGPAGSSRRGWPRWLTRASAALVAAGAATAATALVTAAHAHQADTHPLHAAAAMSAAATLRVVVADDPRPLPHAGYAGQPGGAERYAVAAKLKAATIAGTTWSRGGRVLLLAPADGWSSLLPGQQVTADGLLAPPDRRDLTVAVLRVRGPPGQVTQPPWWQRAAGAVRGGLHDACQVLPEESAGLPGGR